MGEKGRVDVFLVENDAAMERAICGELPKIYDVTVARDAQAAHKAVAGALKTDIFIIDADLDGPGDAAYTLCQTIKANPAYAHIPVVILSSDDQAEAEDRGFQAGASDILRKPFSPYALGVRLQFQLRLYRYIRSERDEAKSQEEILEQIGKFAHSVAQASNNGFEVQSRLHILNLDPIRDIFGSRWDRAKDKIVFISDTTINTSMNRGEAYRYFNPNIFAVIYPSLTHAEGKVRIRALAEQLCAKLLGDEYKNGQKSLELVSRVLKFDPIDNKGDDQDQKLGPAQIEKRILADIKNEYSPIWNPMNKTVEGYRIIFKREYYGKVLSGLDVLHGGPGDSLWSSVYNTVFHEIIGHITSNEGKSPYYVIPIHIETLSSDDFLKTFRKFSAIPMIKYKVRIELIGVNDDVKLPLLKNAFGIMKGLSDVIITRISPDSPIVHDLKMFGVTSISLNLQELSQCGLGQRGSFVVSSHFAKKGLAVGFQRYAWGINDVPDFQMTSAANYDLFSGDVFVQPGRDQNSIYPLAASLLITPPSA